MIWILTALYFFICSVLLWLGFWLYGKALMYLGGAGTIAKNLGGFVVYVLFACLLVAPLFVAFGFMEGWREEFNSNLLYMVYFLLLFVLAAAPGGLYFKKHYLNTLRKLGYFAKRR
ncbi:hypothetical protein [Marinobacter nauticus]|jgi:hypothetical protein|nr:hypothetical protein [Marinobacter nauticus]|tara:strand:+ start:157 stop:504 length:348 start_codon:yes stop_codon:yes gene_type:complete